MGVRVSAYKCGSVSVKRDDLRTLQSFAACFQTHVLDLLLKGPQLVSIVTIHTKTVSKQSILTQRDELQRFVDAWGPDNSEALFIAYLTMFFKFIEIAMRNR